MGLLNHMGRKTGISHKRKELLSLMNYSSSLLGENNEINDDINWRTFGEHKSDNYKDHMSLM